MAADTVAAGACEVWRAHGCGRGWVGRYSYLTDQKQLLAMCPNPFDENRNKINRQVTFPSVLDLSGHLAFEQQGGQYIYELRAIGVHSGATLRSGHFHLNDRTDGNWNNISDTAFTRLADLEARAPIGATHAVYRVRG